MMVKGTLQNTWRWEQREKQEMSQSNTLATYSFIPSQYLTAMYQSSTASRARQGVKGRNKQEEMKRSQSLEQGLRRTTAEKNQTILCVVGEGESSYSSIYCPWSLALYYAMFLFKKCNAVNGSNYSDFQQMAIPRCFLWIFILSIIFIQEQSKQKSTSFAKWSNFFWSNLNECFSSPILPIHFLSFIRLRKPIRVSKHTIEDVAKLKKNTVSWNEFNLPF